MPQPIQRSPAGDAKARVLPVLLRSRHEVVGVAHGIERDSPIRPPLQPALFDARVPLVASTKIPLVFEDVAIPADAEHVHLGQLMITDPLGIFVFPLAHELVAPLRVAVATEEKHLQMISRLARARSPSSPERLGQRDDLGWHSKTGITAGQARQNLGVPVGPCQVVLPCSKLYADGLLGQGGGLR